MFMIMLKPRLGLSPHGMGFNIGPLNLGSRLDNPSPSLACPIDRPRLTTVVMQGACGGWQVLSLSAFVHFYIVIIVWVWV